MRFDTTRRKFEALVTAASLGLVFLGLANGFPTILVVALAIAPLCGYIAGGRAPGRGAGAACVALAVGSTLVRPSAAGASAPPGDLLLLVFLAVGAVAAARFADRMAPARSPSIPPLAADGRWMTVIIEREEGPTDFVPKDDLPQDPPRPEPERRRIARVANDRVQGRRCIPRPKLQSTRS